MLLSAAIFASVAAAVPAAKPYLFAPEHGSTLGTDKVSDGVGAMLRDAIFANEQQVLTNMPVPYNLSTSQTLGGSFSHVDFPYLC
jgi:hypothetical protein